MPYRRNSSLLEIWERVTFQACFGFVPLQAQLLPLYFLLHMIVGIVFLRSTLEAFKSHEEHLFSTVVLVGPPLQMFLPECL